MPTSEGANWAEARYASEDVSSFQYDNSIPISSYYTLSNSIFIRFISDNSVGSVFIPEPTKEKISSMIKKQVKLVCLIVLLTFTNQANKK